MSKAAQDIVSLQKISYKQDYSKQAMAKKREIRNSTVEFLTFVAEGKENGIQVLYKDETIWATQKAMAVLFVDGRNSDVKQYCHRFLGSPNSLVLI